MLNDNEIKQLAQEIVRAKMTESLSQDKVREIFLAEIRRLAGVAFEKETRTLVGDDVKQMIRVQTRTMIQNWLDQNVPAALAKIQLNNDHLRSLIQAEIEQIKGHVNNLVKEETGRLVKQAVGQKIGVKVAKLLELFDKVLIQS